MEREPRIIRKEKVIKGVCTALTAGLATAFLKKTFESWWNSPDRNVPPSRMIEIKAKPLSKPSHP